MATIPFAESRPDIITVAFAELDRLGDADRAAALLRLHQGVISRAVEMIPVRYPEAGAEISVRQMSNKISQGGNLVAWTEVNRK